MTNTIIFTGYLAEQIRLCAERANKTPEAFIVSLFAEGCNAPAESAAHLPRRNISRHGVHCTQNRRAGKGAA